VCYNSNLKLQSSNVYTHALMHECACSVHATTMEANLKALLDQSNYMFEKLNQDSACAV